MKRRWSVEWSCGVGGGSSANGSFANGAVGLRLRSTWLMAFLVLKDRGRAALDFAAGPPPTPQLRDRFAL